MDKFPEQAFRHQIETRGIQDPRVLKALRDLSRGAFLPQALKARAYEDGPLSIGSGQTISQPYIVALMTQAAQLKGDERVLEVGTGCGYQTAVLSALAKEVYSIEILPELQTSARETLTRLGVSNVHFRIGDGHLGWPEAAPFSAIVVTAAPAKVPDALLAQLAPGGRLIIPVGEAHQELLRFTRQGSEFKRETLSKVRFVPLVPGP